MSPPLKSSQTSEQRLEKETKTLELTSLMGRIAGTDWAEE